MVVRESIVFDVSQARPALDEVGLGLRGAAEAADDLSGRAGKMAQALGVVSPQAQAIGMAIADLADGLSLIGTPAGAASVAVLGVGAASLGAVALVGGLTVALVDLARSTAEALPDLRELQTAAGVELVPEATAQRIERTAGALDAFEASSSAAGAALVDVFAPALQEAATLAIQAALGLRDLIVRGADLGGVFLDLGLAVADGFLAPLRGVMGLLASMIDTAASVADALGRDGLAASLREVGAAALTLASEGVVAGGLEELRAGLATYKDEALKLVDAQTTLNTSEKGVAESVKETTKAIDEQRKAWIEAGLARENAYIRDQQDEERRLAALEAAGAKREADQIAAVENTAAYAQMLADRRMGILSDAASVAQGGLSAGLGIVSQAGPVGAVIAQVIQLIQGIESGMLDQMHGEIMTIFEGLPDLPDQLATGIEKSITEGIPALAEGLAGLVVNLPEAVYRGIVASFVDMPQAMAQAVRDAIAELTDGIRERREARQARRAADDEPVASTRSTGGGNASRTTGAHDGRPEPERVLALGLWPALNNGDRRNNLTSTSGTRYGAAGPTRT